MKTYDPGCGVHISDACKGAVEMAIREGADVSFSFNDIEMVAAPYTKPDELAEEYSVASQRRYDEYQASPEGQQAARERAEEIARKQDSHDALVRGLKTAIGSGQDAIMAVYFGIIP